MRYIRSSETVISEMAVSEMANERISDETFHRTFYHAVHCGSQDPGIFPREQVCCGDMLLLQA